MTTALIHQEDSVGRLSSNTDQEDRLGSSQLQAPPLAGLGAVEDPPTLAATGCLGPLLQGH